MKILYLLQEFPYPLVGGAAVKVYNLISYMSSRHDCHLMSYGDGDLTAKADSFLKKVPGVKIEGLFDKCNGFRLQINQARSFIKGKPVFLQRWKTREFLSALKNHLRDNAYDLIHLDALAMAPYVEFLDTYPVVISTTDAVSLCYSHQIKATLSLPKKAYRWLESKKIVSFEKKMLPKFTRVHVVSRVDRDYLQNLNNGIKVEHIEHGVPDSVLSFKNNRSSEKHDSPHILLPGGLINTAAVSTGILRFLSSVYPVIYDFCKDVKVTIIGRYPSRQLRRKMASLPGINYINWVEDYYTEHTKADVVVLTDWSGSGIKTRFLYALGLGCPVVASPAASAGFDFTDGIHFLKRELDKTFADAIISLLNDRRLKLKLAANARRLMMGNFSKDALGSRWEALYKEAVEKK